MNKQYHFNNHICCSAQFMRAKCYTKCNSHFSTNYHFHFTPAPTTTPTITPTATETPDPNMPPDATGKDAQGNYMKVENSVTYTWETNVPTGNNTENERMV